MSISLSNANAAQWNRALMLEFQTTLEKNPTADLMSTFSDSYFLDITRLNTISYLMPQVSISEY